MSYGQAQEPKPKRRLVQLHVIADELGDALAGDIQDDDIEYVNEVPANLEIEADHEQIFRVIHNLSRNAVQALKADDEAAVVKRVCVGAVSEDNTVRIFVDDTGPGMPAKAKEHLFKPFRGSARAGGTGLGLAIAKELIEAHGGTITLTDKSSTGTRFEIVIPMQA
jgi:signal transduction histidine kinase